MSDGVTVKVKIKLAGSWTNDHLETLMVMEMPVLSLQLHIDHLTLWLSFHAVVVHWIFPLRQTEAAQFVVWIPDQPARQFKHSWLWCTVTFI